MDLHAVPGEIEPLRCADVFAAQRGVVELRQALSFAVVELLRTVAAEGGNEDPAIRNVEIVDGTAPIGKRGDPAVLELIELGGVEARGDEVERIADDLDVPAAAVADVAADG